jgi:hypothetical protein
MNIEKEYIKIGKAVIDECIERADERNDTVIIRSVQCNGRLYIRIEDRIEILSEWDYKDLLAVRTANRQQGARERTEALAKKIRDALMSEEPPRVVRVE